MKTIKKIEIIEVEVWTIFVLGIVRNALVYVLAILAIWFTKFLLGGLGESIDPVSKVVLMYISIYYWIGGAWCLNNEWNKFDAKWQNKLIDRWLMKLLFSAL